MLAHPLPPIFSSSSTEKHFSPFAFGADMSLFHPSTPSPSPVDACSRSAITQPHLFLHQDQHQLQNHTEPLPDLPADKYHHLDHTTRPMSEPAALSPIYYASAQSSSPSSATMSNHPFASSSGDNTEPSSVVNSRQLFASSLHPRASTGSLRDIRLQHIATTYSSHANSLSNTNNQVQESYTSYLDDEQPVSPTSTFAHGLPPPLANAPHEHAPPPSSSGSSGSGALRIPQHGFCHINLLSYAQQQPYSPLSDSPSMYGPSPPGTGTSTSSSLASGAYGSLGSSGLSGSSFGGPPLTPCSPTRRMPTHLRRDGAISISGVPFSGRSNDGSATVHGSSSDNGAAGSGSDGDHRTFAFVALPGNAVKKRPRRRYDEIERMYRCVWPECGKAYGTLNHLNAHVSMQRHGKKRAPVEFKELRQKWRKARKEMQETAALAHQLGLGPHHTLSRRQSFPGSFGTTQSMYVDEANEELYQRPSHSSHGFEGAAHQHNHHHNHHQQIEFGVGVDLDFDYELEQQPQRQQQLLLQQHSFGNNGSLNPNPPSFASSRLFHQQQQHQPSMHRQQSHLPPSMLASWNQQQNHQQEPHHHHHHSQLSQLDIPRRPQQLHEPQHHQRLDLQLDADAQVYHQHQHHHDAASPFGFNAGTGAGGIASVSATPAPNFHSQSQSPAGSRPGTGAGYVQLGQGHGHGQVEHGLRRSLSASLQEEEELQMHHHHQQQQQQQHSQEVYA